MNKKDIKKLSNKELKRQIKELHDTIYCINCFGRRDLILFNWLIEEANQRRLELTCCG